MANFKIKNDTLTIRPYGVGNDLIQTYGGPTGAPLDWNAETALQAIAHSTLEDLTNNKDGIQEALQFLNNKVNAVRKTISFWDAYKINAVIDNPTNINIMIAQMPVNTSIVNNCAIPFQWYDDNNNVHTVYSGDVFIKNDTGTVYLIAATNKGIYVPTEIQGPTGSNPNWTLVYSYTNNNDGQNKSITIPVLPSDKAEWGYGIQGTLTPGGNVLIQWAGPTGNPIKPIIKYFLNGEQVFLDGPSFTMGPTGFLLQNTSLFTLDYEVK